MFKDPNRITTVAIVNLVHIKNSGGKGRRLVTVDLVTACSLTQLQEKESQGSQGICAVRCAIPLALKQHGSVRLSRSVARTQTAVTVPEEETKHL